LERPEQAVPLQQGRAMTAVMVILVLVGTHVAVVVEEQVK
jgi:hypothetical protein